MRVDWSKNLAEGTPDQMSADPLYWFLPGAQTDRHRLLRRRGRRSPAQPGSPDRPLRLHRLRHQGDAHAGVQRVLAPVRHLRRRLAVELRSGGDRLPQLADAGAGDVGVRAAVVPRPPDPARHATGKPLRMAFTDQRHDPVHAAGAGGERADGRRLHGGVAGSVREVRLLPHGPADLRPADRRDGGGAAVLHQPLEHLERDDQEGHATASRSWTPTATRTGSISRSARRGPSPTT